MTKQKAFSYRFAIGSPELRSSSYTIFTNPQKSDVYVGHRGIVKDVKVSLHESGENQWSYTGDTKHTIALQNAATNGRHIHKWTGVPVHPAGCFFHLQIIFPTSELRHLAKDVNDKTIEWIEAAPKEHQVIVALFTGANGPPLFPNSSNEVLKEFVLPNSKKLWIVKLITPAPEMENPKSGKPDVRRVEMITKQPVPAFVDWADH